MNSVSYQRGLHEPMEYYDDCTKRDRNSSEEKGRGEGRGGGGGGGEIS